MRKSRKRMSRRRASRKRVSRRRVSRKKLSRKKSKRISRKLRYRTKSKKKEDNKKTKLLRRLYGPSSTIDRSDARRRLMEDAPSAAGQAGIYKKKEKRRQKWLRSRGGNLETKQMAKILDELLRVGGDLDQEEMMANFVDMGPSGGGGGGGGGGGKLPPGWHEYFDKSDTPYYHNPTLGKTTWDRPEE